MNVIRCATLLAAITGALGAACADAQYKLTPLVTFGGTNGRYPASTLVADADGNLYGTAVYGGTPSGGGGGTVFRIANDANHTLTKLAAFNGGSDGARPYGGLTM